MQDDDYLDRGMQVVAGRRPRGEYMIDQGGNARWRAFKNQEWRKAAFHNVLRDALIQEASIKGTYMHRIHTHGPLGPNDVTSFNSIQAEWGAERQHRPPKTFQILRTPEKEPDYPLRVWIWRNHVVLDHKGHPLLDFKALPATICSKEAGVFLEGFYREDPRIAFHDIASRMPWSKPPLLFPTPLISYRTVGMRRSRFRLQAGCISWCEREGSAELKAQILQFLPDQCKKSNSTQAFRDLTLYEIRQIELSGRRKHPERAGIRALDDRAREARDDTFVRRMIRTKARHVLNEVENFEASSEKKVAGSERKLGAEMAPELHPDLADSQEFFTTANQTSPRDAISFTLDDENEIIAPAFSGDDQKYKNPPRKIPNRALVGEPPRLIMSRPEGAFYQDRKQDMDSFRVNPFSFYTAFPDHEAEQSDRMSWDNHIQPQQLGSSGNNLSDTQPMEDFTATHFSGLSNEFTDSLNQAPSNSRPPASPKNPQTPPIDFRFILPLSEREIHIVNTALEPTRHHLSVHLFQMTGKIQPLPRIPIMSYYDAYQWLVGFFRNFWQMMGREGQAPRLRAVGAWWDKFPEADLGMEVREGFGVMESFA